MKITQLMLSSGFGGAERSFVDLALALASRGNTVQAICHPDFVKRHELEAHAGIVVSTVTARFAWDPWALFGIRRHLRHFSPDVVHAHLSRGAALASRAAQPLGVPVIATLHNYSKMKYYRRIQDFVATTPDLKSYLMQQGIDGDRVGVVSNFARFSAVDQSRANPGVPVRLLTCGRLHHVKGYDLLLRALRQVLDAGENAELTIAGDGPERAALESLTKELRLDKQVTFLGWVNNVSALLDRQDLYVVSSRSESFGIAILEAMARGLPIVTTRTAGPAMILDSTSAIFADVENPESLATALLHAIRSPAELASLASEALIQYRTKYTESVCVPRILEHYESVTSRSLQRAVLVK